MIEKYGGEGNPLYPSDAETRAVIHQRMYFDMGTLFQSFKNYYMAAMFGGEAKPENLKKCENAMELLNGFLEKSGFVAGTEEMSIADIVIFASVSTFEIAGFDFSAYPKVEEWLEMMKESAPGRETNEEGLEMMKQFFEK